MSGTVLGEKFSVSISAWDSITEAEKTITIADATGSVSVEREVYFVLPLAGSILALISALVVLASPRMKILIALLTIGGILSIVGAGWGYFDISSELERLVTLSPNIEVSIDYGLYLCLTGGILTLIGGIMSVRGE